MCHKHIFWGGALVAFGAGLLIGLWLEGGFFCHCFSLALIIAGGCMCRRKRS